LPTLSTAEGASFDLCVVGGAGHVGLPLSILFAVKGLRIIIYDIDVAAIQTIAAGKMPFLERGAEPLLREALHSGRLILVLPLDDVILRSDILILCTPHQVYRELTFPGKVVVDIWNFWGGRQARRAAA